MCMSVVCTNCVCAWVHATVHVTMEARGYHQLPWSITVYLIPLRQDLNLELDWPPSNPSSPPVLAAQ